MQDEVASGALPLSEALLKQSVLNRRLEEAEADVAAGRVHLADDAFYDAIRSEIRKTAAR